MTVPLPKINPTETLRLVKQVVPVKKTKLIRFGNSPDQEIASQWTSKNRKCKKSSYKRPEVIPGNDPW